MTNKFERAATPRHATPRHATPSIRAWKVASHPFDSFNGRNLVVDHLLAKRTVKRGILSSSACEDRRMARPKRRPALEDYYALGTKKPDHLVCSPLRNYAPCIHRGDEAWIETCVGLDKAGDHSTRLRCIDSQANPRISRYVDVVCRLNSRLSLL